jgi:hypothetical protein
VRAWIAPIGLTGQTAERAHLNCVDGAGRKVIKDDVLRVAREHACYPITGRPFDPAFVHTRVFHRWFNAPHELTAGAVFNHKPGRLFERRLRLLHSSCCLAVADRKV